MAIWKKDDLSSKQTDAILNEGNVFLVACPGSGKTRTLTYKIAHELSKLESKKKYIVGITYTNAAANEIHDRIDAMGIDTSQLWIGTIHSFCLEWIIKPYGIYHPETKFGYRVINSYDTETMISDLCREVTSQKITYYNCEHYFDSNGLNITCSDECRENVDKTISEYHELLRANRQLDFELILWYSFELITQRKSISKLLSNIFSYILIDEYQDTKDIQYHILTSIWNAGNGNVKAFVVGDPNQAIFTSLGGYAIEIQDLSNLSQLTFQPLELVSNYRNSERIVDFFGNFKVFGSTIKSFANHKDYQSLITYDDQTSASDLPEKIAQLIELNINDYEISPNEICVVGPWWIHLASLTRNLVALMPDIDFNGPGLTPFAKDIENIWYKVSRLVLTEPSPSIYVRRMRWANEVLGFFKDAGIDVEKLSPRDFLRDVNSITCDEDDGLTYLESFFFKLFDKYGLQIENYPVLVEHKTAFFERSKKLINQLEGDGYTYAGNIDTFRRSFCQKSGVTVSTIHGVKGTEFDTVIAFGILDGVVPHFSDPNQETSAKKLLYVVGSRARKNLHLISEIRTDKWGRTKRPTAQLSNLKFEYGK